MFPRHACRLASHHIAQVRGVERLEGRETPTAGLIDTTFGSNGPAGHGLTRLMSNLKGDDITAVRVTDQQQIALAGSARDYTGTSSTTASEQARLSLDGHVDTGFANGVTSGDSGLQFYPSSGTPLLLPDGRAVCATVSGGATVTLVRYKADGTTAPDPGFGTSGTAHVTFDNATSVSGVITRQDAAGGLLVGVTTTRADGEHYTAVARFTSDGLFDTSYGTGGQTSVGFGSLAGMDATPTGRLVVAFADGGIPPTTLVRLTAIGQPDATFGSQGSATIDLLDVGVPSSVTVEADGSILLLSDHEMLGYVNTSGLLSVVTRVRADGTVDTGFGDDGSTLLPLQGDAATILGGKLSLAVQSDGRIFVLGQSNATEDSAVVRLTADGHLDPSYGTGGVASIVDSTYTDSPIALTVLASGQAVVVTRLYPKVFNQTTRLGLGVYRLTADDGTTPALTLAPSPSLVVAVVNQPFSLTTAATGGTGAVSYTVTAGTLPTGLTLDPATGLISGTVADTSTTSGGVVYFGTIQQSAVVTATDAAGHTGSRSYSFVKTVPYTTLVPASLPDGTVGQVYGPVTLSPGPNAYPGGPGFSYTLSNFHYTPSDPTTPGTAGATGGLTLTPEGTLDGTPTAAGTYAFTLSAHRADDTLNYTDDTQNYVITVSPGATSPPVSPPPPASPPAVSPPPTASPSPPFSPPPPANPPPPPASPPPPITTPGHVYLRAVGADVGGGPRVRAFRADGSVALDTYAFEPTFTGGVRVATADVTGDGVDDIICAAGDGGGPRIRIFDGATGQSVRDFFAFTDTLRVGVFVSAADVTGDGVADYAVTAGQGGGPRVALFDGRTGERLIGDFFAFDPDSRDGATVALGAVLPNGAMGIAAGQLAGGSTVRTFDLTGAKQGEFVAYEPGFQGGVNLSVAPTGGLLTGAGPGGGPRVRQFAADGSTVSDGFAGDDADRQGVKVGIAVVGGQHELVTSVGGAVRDADAESLTAFDGERLGGVWVS